MIKIAAIAAAAMVLAACSPQFIASTQPQYQPRGPEIDDGPYETRVVVKGRERATGHFGPGLPMHAWRLESAFDKASGVVTRYVRFRNYYAARDWRYWEHAATDRGERLEVDALDRRVLGCGAGCSFYEEVIAVLPDAVVRRGAIDVRISTRRDEGHVAKFDAAEVSDLLAREAEALAAYRAAQGAKAQ